MKATKKTAKAKTATKAKTTKATKAVKTTKEVKAAKPVPPQPAKGDVPKLERGYEFANLRDNFGFSVSDTVKFYAEAGISIAVPTVYNALKLVDAPDAVREAVASGKLTISDAVKVVSGRGITEKKMLQNLKDIVTARREKRSFLKSEGFKANGKITKSRIVSIVGKNLAEIRKTGALRDARAKAVLAFINALEQGQTAEALVASLTKK